MTYGILAWGKKSTRVDILQKKALPVTTRSRFNDHTEPLFKSLNLLKFDDLFILTELKFYYNYCHRLLPFYLQSFELCQRQEIHTHDIRSKHNLHTLRAETRMAENSVRNFFPKLINETPKNILDKIFTHSLKGFAFYIKQYCLNLYSACCTINNCYICNR